MPCGIAGRRRSGRDPSSTPALAFGVTVPFSRSCCEARAGAPEAPGPGSPRPSGRPSVGHRPTRSSVKDRCTSAGHRRPASPGVAVAGVLSSARRNSVGRRPLGRTGHPTGTARLQQSSYRPDSRPSPPADLERAPRRGPRSCRWRPGSVDDRRRRAGRRPGRSDGGPRCSRRPGRPGAARWRAGSGRRRPRDASSTRSGTSVGHVVRLGTPGRTRPRPPPPRRRRGTGRRRSAPAAASPRPARACRRAARRSPPRPGPRTSRSRARSTAGMSSSGSDMSLPNCSAGGSAMPT